MDFWFDYRCPYAWFSLPSLRRLAEANPERPLRLRPFRMPPASPPPPAKAAWLLDDRRRQAEWHGVPYQERGAPEVEALLAKSLGIAWAEMEGVFRAIWAEGGEGALLGRMLPGRMLPGRAPDWDGLAENEREAEEKGIFGAPTLEIAGRLHWGADRIAALAGEHGNPPGGPGGATLDFFFDFSSPFAYLAATGIEALAARHRAMLRYRPILLGALFREVGNPNVPLFAMSPARQRWVMDDLARQAAALGVPLHFSPHFPLRTVGALRAVLAESEPGPLVARLFRAAWVEGLDIGDPSVLATCGARMGAIDGQKEALKAETDAARALGVFGVPTFRVDGGAIHWGNDRLGWVERELGGETRDLRS